MVKLGRRAFIKLSVEISYLFRKVPPMETSVKRGSVAGIEKILRHGACKLPGMRVACVGFGNVYICVSERVLGECEF